MPGISIIYFVSTTLFIISGLITYDTADLNQTPKWPAYLLFSAALLTFIAGVIYLGMNNAR